MNLISLLAEGRKMRIDREERDKKRKENREGKEIKYGGHRGEYVFPLSNAECDNNAFSK